MYQAFGQSCLAFGKIYAQSLFEKCTRKTNKQLKHNYKSKNKQILFHFFPLSHYIA